MILCWGERGEGRDRESSKHLAILLISVRDNLSESEAEEVEGHVTVVQDQLDHDRPCNQQSAVKLTEVNILKLLTFPQSSSLFFLPSWVPG